MLSSAITRAAFIGWPSRIDDGVSGPGAPASGTATFLKSFESRDFTIADWIDPAQSGEGGEIGVVRVQFALVLNGEGRKERVSDQVSSHVGSPQERAEERVMTGAWMARCGGKPCIRGHRIWVSLILDLLASGSSRVEILERYPGLTVEDILACIAYGSEMARERYVALPLEPTGA